MLSVNELALEIFDNLADLAEEFNAAYHELDNGARIVDCGVNTRGGYAAGRAFTEIVWAVLERSTSGWGR